MSGSLHLRGIVLAGALAALALALGFVTLAMNQTASRATPQTILPLKDRHHGTAAKRVAPAKPVAPHRVAPAKPADPNVVAAERAGLPAQVANALGRSPVAVVELSSREDPVAQLSAVEARLGAADAGAAFVAIGVDSDGGAVGTLTRLLGRLPDVPASLVFVRPATLYVTLPGFNDRKAVQQAAASAALTVVPPPVAAPSWAQQADALCAAASSQLAALGGPSNAKRLAAQKSRFEGIATTFLAKLKELTPPAGSAAQVAQLNRLLEENFAAIDGMVAAYTLKNRPAMAAALHRAGAIAPQLNGLVRQLGATGCAGLATS